MRWLADKSALEWMSRSQDRDDWNGRIERGLVHLSSITRLEIGYSARNGAAARVAFSVPPLSLMPVEYVTMAVEDRAHEVQMMLAERGQHRAPSIPDLLVAASAELAGLAVLHVDKDFDLIAALTGQPVERLALAADRLATQ